MKDTFSEISKLFEFAEGKIKLIENLNEDGLSLPAVNQLRYVAFHLIRAENTIEEVTKDKELKKAQNHCQRAIYDASETGIVYFLDKIKDFQTDYRLNPIVEVISTYIEICKRVDKINKFLSEATRHSIGDHSNNRGDHYKKSTEFFEELKSYSELLESARPELNKKIRKEQITFRISVSALICAILSLIVAAIK